MKYLLIWPWVFRFFCNIALLHLVGVLWGIHGSVTDHGVIPCDFICTRNVNICTRLLQRQFLLMEAHMHCALPSCTVNRKYYYSEIHQERFFTRQPNYVWVQMRFVATVLKYKRRNPTSVKVLKVDTAFNVTACSAFIRRCPHLVPKEWM